MVMAPRTDNGRFLPDDELLTAPSRCGSSSPRSPILLQRWAVFIGPTTTSYNVGIQPWPSGLQRRLPAWVDLKFGGTGCSLATRYLQISQQLNSAPDFGFLSIRNASIECG